MLEYFSNTENIKSKACLAIFMFIYILQGGVILLLSMYRQANRHISLILNTYKRK